MPKVTPVSAAITLLLIASGHSRVSLGASIVLTSKENGVQSENDFGCSGQIHGYIRLAHTAVGTHTLEGIWSLPNGKPAAHSMTTVDFAPPGRSTAYIWYAFPERRTRLAEDDPAWDEQALAFSGIWQVEARWDSASLVHSTFTVHCR